MFINLHFDFHAGVCILICDQRRPPDTIASGLIPRTRRLFPSRSYSPRLVPLLLRAALDGGHVSTEPTIGTPTPTGILYSVRKGLLYSHLGWMVFKQNPRRIGRTDITDLNEDPVVVWQHKNYIELCHHDGHRPSEPRFVVLDGTTFSVVLSMLES